MWMFYYSGVISIHCSDSVAAIFRRFSCKTLDRLLVNPGKAGKRPLWRLCDGEFFSRYLWFKVYDCTGVFSNRRDCRKAKEKLICGHVSCVSMVNRLSISILSVLYYCNVTCAGGATICSGA